MKILPEYFQGAVLRSFSCPTPAIFVFEASRTNEQAYEAMICGQAQGKTLEK